MADLHQDILGQGLLAFFNGDNYASFDVSINGLPDEEMPVAVFFREWKDMPEAEQKALSLAKGKVLDIGAAAGCHSLILQENFSTISLDISEGAVEIMRARGITNPVLESFYDFTPKDKFDTIYLLMNGLGIAQSVQNTPRFFAKLKSLLAPGGQNIGDSSDLIYLKDDPEDGGMLGKEYYGEVAFQMGFRDKKGERFDWVYFDPKSFALLAKASGFHFELLHEGDHYDYLCRLTLDE